MLVALRLKEIFTYRLTLFIFLAAPVIFGFASAYAHSGATQTLRVGILDEDGTALSRLYISGLETAGMDIAMLSSADEAAALLRLRRIEGCAVIHAGFGDAMAERSAGAVQYMPAPGAVTAGLIADKLSLNALIVRSYFMFTTAMENLQSGAGADIYGESDLREIFLRNANEEAVLSLRLHNRENAAGLTLGIPPRHGAAMLAASLSTLFTALWLGSGRKMAAACGAKAVRRNYFASVAAIAIVLLLQLAVYWTTVGLIYGDGVLRSLRDNLPLMRAHAGLLFYFMGTGAALARFLPDWRNAVYVFPFFFLLNATAGGALWGLVPDNFALKLMAPISIFLESQGGWCGTLLLFALGGILVFISRHKLARGERINMYKGNL